MGNQLTKMENTEEQFNENQHLYKRKFGAFKPKLKGTVEGSYSNTWCGFFVILFMLLPAYAISFSIWYGLYTWGLNDTYGYCYFSAAMFMLYIVVIIFVVHFGSLAKKKTGKSIYLKKNGRKKVD